MSLPLVRPGLLWALDELGQRVAQQWLESLDDAHQSLVRVIENSSEASTIVREFNRESYREGIRKKLGLTLDERGTRVTCVLLANGMDDGTSREWVSAWKFLEGLEKEVEAIDRHPIILARHEEYRVQQRRIFLPPIPIAPWLVSTRSNQGVTIEDETFQDIIALLLQVLFFVDRSDPSGLATTNLLCNLSGADKIRLVGVPTLTLQTALDDAGQQAMKAMARELAMCPGNATHIQAEMTSRLARETKSYLLGDITAQQLLKRILGDDGVGGLDAVDMLHSGTNVLQSLLHPTSLLRRAIQGEPLGTEVVAHRHSKKWWPDWLEDILWRLRLLPEERRYRAQHAVRTEEELVLVKVSLEAALELLDGLRDKVLRSGQVVHSVPRDVLQRWHSEFHLLLRGMLDSISREPQLSDTGCDRAWRYATAGLLGDISANFPQVLLDWGLSGEDVEQFKTMLEDGSLFRFSAKLGPGQSYEPCAVLASANLDPRIKVQEHHVQSAQIRVWGSTRSVILVPTRPLPAAQLVW